MRLLMRIWKYVFARRAFISIEKRYPHAFLPVGHQYDLLKPYGLCLPLLPFSIDINALRANWLFIFSAFGLKEEEDL